MTIDDINQQIYAEWRAEGYSKEECLDMVPKGARETFRRSIEMDPIEAHYGLTPKGHLIWWVVAPLICVALILLLLVLTEY